MKPLLTAIMATLILSACSTPPPTPEPVDTLMLCADWCRAIRGVACAGMLRDAENGLAPTYAYVCKGDRAPKR